MTAIRTVADLVRVPARQRPDAPALTAGDVTWSWAELDRRSSRAARALAAEGVGAQERVAFLGRNVPEFFEVLLGAAKVNAVTVAVNWRLAPAEVAYILNDAEARALVVTADFVPVVRAVAGDLTTVKKVVVVGGDEDDLEAFGSWVATAPDDDPGIEAGDDDVALQLYTSGTTGLPKGAMLANRNVTAMLPGTSADWGFDADSVNLVSMPLFHVGGVGWAMVGMYVGAHSVLVREVDPAEILRVIPRHGVTHALFVPAVLQMLLATPGVEEADFSSLGCIVYGASPISVEVLSRSIERFGCRFIQGYGLTESCGAVVHLLPDDHDPDGPNAHRLRAAGVPMRDAEVRIVLPAGGDAPSGEVGEIWLRAPQVMKGYWKRPDDTAATITPDGWLRTGDAGYLDEDGYLYIHDRVKDMIISGGENIYPAEVENALMSHPGVADVAVIGVPSERWGETPKAIVVPAAGAAPSPEELIAHCRERLARYKAPTSVDFVDAIPRNPAGKILKRELRRPYWEGAGRGVN
ncbi:MAG TPA: long-chain-fatty-acid--CoA ligase [Acidimicrobiales bacterium]|jgi:long-chain acyl-CoA synthetase